MTNSLLTRAFGALGIPKKNEHVNRKRRNLYGSDGNIPYKVDGRGNLIKKRSYKASALGKSIDDVQKESEQKDGVINSLKEKTRQFFFLSIPETLQESVSNLPVVFIVSFGLLANLLFLGSFVFFTNYTYEANISSPFLAASKESGVCQSIGKEISGVYMFDSNGVWSGSNAFLSNEAIYRFEFNNYAPNATHSYSNFINIYKTDFLDDLAILATNQSIAINLLYWMKFRATVTTGAGSKQVMRFTGSSENVFDTKKYLVGLSSGNIDMGQCSSASKPSHAYYRSSSSIVFTWTNDVYAESCYSNVSSSKNLGYDENFDGDLFSLSVDFETLVSVVAVNWGGIVGLSEMTEVTNASVVAHKGFTYSASYFFDDTKPAMKAFLCLKLLKASSYYSVRNNFDSFCFVELATTYAIPLFTHIGYSLGGKMSECSCPTVDDYCHQLDLLSGLLFYPTENYADPSAASLYSTGTTSSSPRLTEDLLELAWNYTARELNSAAYDAMVGTAYSVYLSADRIDIDAYNFCNNSCAIITVDSYTENAYPKVSDYYRFLEDGSCSNSFINDNWNKITTSSPTSLLENYVLCTPTIRDAFQNALGVAQGLATTLHPFLLVICLPLIYIFLKYNGLLVYLEETYSKVDKEITLNELAEYILLVRDGRRTNLPEGSTVVQLANEMIVAARNHILDEEARLEQMYDEFRDLKKLRSKRRLSGTHALKDKVKGKLKHIHKKSIMMRGTGDSMNRYISSDENAGVGVTLTPSFSSHIDVASPTSDDTDGGADGDIQIPHHPMSEKHFRRYSALPARANGTHDEPILSTINLADIFEAGTGVEEKQEIGHFNELNKELSGLLSFLDPAVVSTSSSNSSNSNNAAVGGGLEKRQTDHRSVSFDIAHPVASSAASELLPSPSRKPDVSAEPVRTANYSRSNIDDGDDDSGSSVSSFSDDEVRKISMPPPFRSAKRHQSETLHEL